jgi:hypothetical protein
MVVDRMEASDRRLIYENWHSFRGKIIPLMLAVALGLGLMGSSCLIKGSSGEANQTLPDKQSTTGLMSSISTRALIQPVLLAPIAVSGENVFIVWPDNRTFDSPHPDFDRAHLPAFKNTVHANWDIFLVQSSDHGQTFTEPINLSNSANGTSIGAEVAVRDRGLNQASIYVTFWDNKTGENNPYFIFSNDSGIKFSKPIMLNVTTIR